MPKDYQLRVRIDGGQAQQLFDIAKQRKESLSDVIRNAIEYYLDMDSVPDSGDPQVTLSKEGFTTAQRLASFLQRDVSQVVEDAVVGIADSHEHNRTPLIVMELNLRRTYFDEMRSDLNQATGI